MKKIEINPVTRLEGHAKIAIFLNDEGNVENAYFQAPELRGFERFCQGRNAEEMPRITTSICGVCPVAHHMAGAKVLDDLYNVEPTPTGEKIRKLMYNTYIFSDHVLHFFYLGAPDFYVGPDADPAKRNLLDMIEKVGLDFGKKVIKHRSYSQNILKTIGGDPIQPVNCMAGGVTKGLSGVERQDIEKKAGECLEFAKFALKTFNDVVLENEDYVELIKSDPYTLDTHYMGLVDENDHVNFYDGIVRAVDTSGDEIVRFEGQNYLDHIAEKVHDSWTYLKFPYLKEKGWKGIESGGESGIYRVGPLARLNAAEGMATPLAQEEYGRMFEVLGGKPVHATLAYHWARLIEVLFAAERMVELASDEDITRGEIRNIPEESPDEGVGVVEAARGTLIHHYKTNERGVLEDVNVIVPTTQNNGGICMAVEKAAKGVISGGEIDQGTLNRVEMAFRTHDPCIACATHSLPGSMPLEVLVYDSEQNEIARSSKGLDAGR
ncbi:F420-nonreducing hydrogenase [candidate division MSBL1 archaeon SCGC-AAA261F17]|uniref:F420-nonreducing hydrogenase n=1 Tax=candidate division MSBL1 archaeon SCGC-AAA261F17 TaxID=1698274 RepID=A0A133V4G3_9EURY|nr:F420-nonreducing hydrogenase [candidate division MSBL1 archaeon SCGC-AAA261F17]